MNVGVLPFQLCFQANREKRVIMVSIHKYKTHYVRMMWLQFTYMLLLKITVRFN